MDCEYRLSTSGVAPDGCFQDQLHALDMHWAAHLRCSSGNRDELGDTFSEGVPSSEPAAAYLVHHQLLSPSLCWLEEHGHTRPRTSSCLDCDLYAYDDFYSSTRAFDNHGNGNENPTTNTLDNNDDS